MNKFSRALAPCIVAGLLVSLASPAFAHERRAEGGVEAVVGWANEPAYTGFPNAVQFMLSDTEGNPITDLDTDALQVEVTFGDRQTPPMNLRPAFQVGSYGTPGDYQADLIPTRPGEYTFRFFGTVNGQPYDQEFTSGPDTFDEPRSAAEVSFPAQDPSTADLAASIEQLSSQGVADNPQGAGGMTMVAIGLAGLALLVALAAIFRKGNSA